MQAFGGEHVPAKLGEDRIESGDASADPVGECRDVEFDALASEGGALPVQRQMVTKLADQDHGEPARAGEAARDRMRGRRRLGDALAVAAGELLAHPLDDLPASRLAFERLRHHLAELAQPGAAALADTHTHGAGSTTRSTGRLSGSLRGPRGARRRGALAGSGAAISGLVSSGCDPN